MAISREDLARIIDSTNVKATATKSDIEKLCREAMKYGFGCVCVNSVYVKLAATLVKDSKVKVCSTMGCAFGDQGFGGC